MHGEKQDGLTNEAAIPFKIPSIAAHRRSKVLPPDRETLNSFFDELQDWEHQIKHSEITGIDELEGPGL